LADLSKKDGGGLKGGSRFSPGLKSVMGLFGPRFNLLELKKVTGM
jgi:hypothetical protein